MHLIGEMYGEKMLQNSKKSSVTHGRSKTEKGIFMLKQEEIQNQL